MTRVRITLRTTVPTACGLIFGDIDAEVEMVVVPRVGEVVWLDGHDDDDDISRFEVAAVEHDLGKGVNVIAARDWPYTEIDAEQVDAERRFLIQSLECVSAGMVH